MEKTNFWLLIVLVVLALADLTINLFVLKDADGQMSFSMPKFKKQQKTQQ